MRLKRHIVDELNKAEEEKRLRKLFGSKDKWAQVVEVFFRHVEDIYLADLISGGLVTTSRAIPEKISADKVKIAAYFIVFANTTIRLNPIFQPTQSSLGIIEVRSSSNIDRRRSFVCDLTRGWLAPVVETGLRAMLRNYLPEKLVAFDENLFYDILFDTVETTEPLFTYDKEKILQHLSCILDDMLDPSRKKSVSRFIGVVKSLPVVGGAKNLGGKVKAVSIPRLSGPHADAQRLVTQDWNGKVGGEVEEG